MGLSAVAQVKTDSVRAHAQAIIDGTANPGDDNLTFAVLDSICSANKDTRAFYLKAFRKTLLLSDGALSEMMGLFIKQYIEKVPAEAALNYKNFTAKEQAVFTYFLAFELWADWPYPYYKTKVPLYFKTVGKSIPATDTEAMRVFRLIESETMKGIERLDKQY